MEANYEKIMTKVAQLEAFSLYVQDWTIREIATEMGKSEPTIRAWEDKFGWRMRKLIELRDIEEEMRAKVQKAREQILDISMQTLDDVFVRDTEGNIIGVSVIVENVRDLKVITEMVTRVGGIPEKVEQVITKDISGKINIKTEKIDPEMAAELGKLIAMKESDSNEDNKNM